jgi:hypothetical protein
MRAHKRKHRGGYGGPQRREFVVNQIAIANRSATLSRFADVRQSRTLPLTFQGQQHAQEDHHGHD